MRYVKLNFLFPFITSPLNSSSLSELMRHRNGDWCKDEAEETDSEVRIWFEEHKNDLIRCGVFMQEIAPGNGR